MSAANGPVRVPLLATRHWFASGNAIGGPIHVNALSGAGNRRAHLLGRAERVTSPVAFDVWVEVLGMRLAVLFRFF